MIKMEEGMMQKFEEEIRALINRNSMENTSNTPDFVLAQFVTTCLNALNIAVQQRETYYGRDSRPSTSSEVEHDCNKEHPGQDVYNPPKPKDSSVGECKCGTQEYCTKHEMPATKPKDSEVWCRHWRWSGSYWEIVNNGNRDDQVGSHIDTIKFCQCCGAKKPEPVKTLAEKFKVFGLTKRWEDSDDVYNTLAEIAREHHKQENRHD